jgi:putative sterol carrier protein
MSSRPQVRLAASSDDLVALVSGDLTPPVAWATGRLTVEASVLDLLRLRSLL